jgi:integrase
MRLGEICQPRTSDLQSERNIPFFNVAEEGDAQSVKTEAGIRHVPLHRELIKCGLLDYAAALPEGQLFPGLAPGGPDGKLSWYFMRVYTTFRRSVGVDRPRVSFHSLRKNVVTCLDSKKIPQSDLAALIGHERSFTFDVYSEGLELERLQGITEKIEYPGLRLGHLYICSYGARGSSVGGDLN